MDKTQAELDDERRREENRVKRFCRDGQTRRPTPGICRELAIRLAQWVSPELYGEADREDLKQAVRCIGELRGRLEAEEEAREGLTVHFDREFDTFDEVRTRATAELMACDEAEKLAKGGGTDGG